MIKTFNNKNINKTELRKIICLTAKTMGVKRVIFNDRGKYVSGTYNAFTGVLYLNLNGTKRHILNTFFHELGHHVSVKAKRFNGYHFNLIPYMNVERIFNIENKIDQAGKKLWNKYVSLKQWGKYKYAYPKSQKQKLMNNFLNSK